ncbi:hypothetical protein P7L87_24840 [Vibrio parahaemolyticus]|nr:hypothetical protein [Vibrio parahaemolyticus]
MTEYPVCVWRKDMESVYALDRTAEAFSEAKDKAAGFFVNRKVLSCRLVGKEVRFFVVWKPEDLAHFRDFYKTNAARGLGYEPDTPTLRVP